MRIYDVDRKRKENPFQQVWNAENMNEVDPVGRLAKAMEKLDPKKPFERDKLHLADMPVTPPPVEEKPPVIEKPPEEKPPKRDINANIMFDALADFTPSRFTDDMFKEVVKKANFLVFPETTTTICCLYLHNGSAVFGMGTCVRANNFDEEIGRDMALDDAKTKLWDYLVFLDTEKRYQNGKT